MSRFRFSFWLDAEKDDELLLMETIDDLKDDRQFTKTIRRGIRLVTALMQGDYDVLFTMFPEAEAHLRARFGVDQIQQDSAVMQYLNQIEAKLATLSVPQDSMAGQSMGIQPLANISALSTPVWDDDDDLVVETVEVEASTSAAENLLASIRAIQMQ